MWFLPARRMRPASRPRTSRRLCWETLEDRSMLTAGGLDPTFGAGGIVFEDYGQIDPAAGAAEVRALFTYPSTDPVNAGKVLAGGFVTAPNVTRTGEDFALMRYNADGTRDLTFGSGGIVTADFFSKPGTFGQDDRIYGLAVDNIGRIVVAGVAHQEVQLSAYSSAYVPDFALARWTAEGRLDTDAINGFGPLDSATGLRAGKFTTAFPNGNSTARAVAIQPDGKVVVSGFAYSSATNHDFALARYQTNGSLDASFGVAGLVTTAIGSGADYARAMVLQADGKILLGGDSYNGKDQDFALARYNANGTLDATFGAGGKVTTGIGATIVGKNKKVVVVGTDEAAGLALDAAGRPVLAGYMTNSTGATDSAMVRYTTSGALDVAFGSGGKVVTDLGGADQGRAVAIQSDGKLILAGLAVPGTMSKDFALARYNANGTLDATFGTGGKVTTAITSQNDGVIALALQADGRILTGGWAYRGLALARHLGDPPAVPGNVTALAVSATQINLTWSAASTNITGYVVERSTDGANFIAVADLEGAVSSYLDTSLSPATRYYYRLKAYSASGSSIFSPIVTASTLAS